MLKKKENKGITLIALVITVIVLLILAGVTIAAISGENGIIQRAVEAREKTEVATDKEKIILAMYEAQIADDGYQKLDATNFQEALNNQFEGRNLQLAENRDGTFTVTLDNKIYDIGNNKVNEVQIDLYINNAEDFKIFRDNVNNGNTYEGKYIMLKNDIMLDINEEWIPIGTYLSENTSVEDETNTPFKGTFDGQNHTIDGLKITSQEKGKGLFGLVNNGTIKNVIIGENCNIDAGISFGSITGYLCNNGSVINCTNKANLKASGANFGGIVGTSTENTKIVDCANIGTMTSEMVVGGIVGNNLGSISYCYNLNTISSKNSAGGICGNNKGIIRECYNVANIVTETTNVGGIVGVLEGENGSVESCYNTGSVTGTGSNVGGVVGVGLGLQNSELLNSYNIGYVTSNNNNGGGVIGFNEATSVSNCYFLENTVNGGNGNSTIDGVEIKSSEELKKLSKTLGSAFKEDSNNINEGYPILSWQ